MEQILLCNRRACMEQGRRLVRLRLVDTNEEQQERITLYHKTDIVASRSDLLNDKTLRNRLDAHILAMCKAYTLMQVKRMDMNSRIFEREVSKMLTDSSPLAKGRPSESMMSRFTRYIEESHRDGVIGDGRYAVVICKARKLQRYLYIKGLTGITARDFSKELLLEYRQFIYDEYLYVSKFPSLYPRGGGHRPPKKRCKDTTVVHDLTILKAFFSELENAGEIRKSPFCRLSSEKRISIMHVMYDDPYFLKADELRQVIQTDVPDELKRAKDIFVLNCAIGCRIGDLQRMTMNKYAISEDGIPYIHYIPSKTSRSQKTNKEVQTPLVPVAVDIVERTHLELFEHNADYGLKCYNDDLKRLLTFCGIQRTVCHFDPVTHDNIYLPICEVATSKLARKTHVDMLNKVQINYYAAGLHKAGSEAVFRYTSLELADRYVLLKAAFGE